MAEHRVDAGGVELAVEDTAAAEAAGLPVVLLHGLTATRRYVVMGSRALERAGRRVLAYDARGHGASSPAPDPAAYGYDELAADLLAVLDAQGIERAVLVGVSMGAHTVLKVALEHPARAAGLGVITPAHLPGAERDAERLARWDALADGLRRGGVDGFLAAYGDPGVPGRLAETVITVMRQRLAVHDHPEAVADALSAVPRSAPFTAVAELARIAVPVAVIASDDGPDPGHPRAVAELYAQTIPGAELLVDEPGRSPRAWQGSQVSAVIAALCARAEAGA